MKQVINNENVRPFDVDGTLVIHDYKKYDIKTVEVFEPATKRFVTMGIHEPMIQLLKEERYRGNFILVWSRAGKQWADNVVMALGLEDQVHLVMTKPLVYFDDIDVSEWLKDRVFLPPDAIYKTNNK